MDAAGENRQIAKAQAGDRDALGELLMAHREACYALALRLTASPNEAEDVCQDAFVRASRDIASYRPVGGFGSWLFKLVVHSHGHRSAAESARRQRERNWGMAHGAGSKQPSQADRATLREQLDRCLARLEQSKRLPIVLHYERGLSYAEAADVLDMPEGTVATNIKRGLEELKGLMTAAGYACTVPAMTGALAEGLAVSVPAGLTAFIQSLTVAAESGAAVVGKAAAGAALKISARFSAKKAAGLALGWKVGAVFTAAAIGGAAVVYTGALQPNRMETGDGVSAKIPADDKRPPRKSRYGRVLFEDDFSAGLGKWDVIVGTRDGGETVVQGDPAPYAVLKTDYRHLENPSSGKTVLLDACVILDSGREPGHFVKLRSKEPIESDRFLIEWHCGIVGYRRPSLNWFYDWGIEMPGAGMIDQMEDNFQIYSPVQRQPFRWKFTRVGTDTFDCRLWDNLDGFHGRHTVRPSGRRIMFGIGDDPTWDVVINRVAVYELIEEEDGGKQPIPP